VSSMANIAEGFTRKSNKEFIQYLFISKSSAAEVQTCPSPARNASQREAGGSLSLRRGGRGHLYVALDQGYITQHDFESIYAQADVVARMDSGFIKYLNSQLNKPLPR